MKRKLAVLATIAIAGFLSATLASLSPVPERLPPAGAGELEARYVDRRGELLSVTYENQWNLHERIPLHEIPEILTEAFVTAEDKRFHAHHGVDWYARLHAAWTNLTSFRAVRGASTITEQVVRMIHPRPRTLWSRWVEGFEAMRLERRFEKAEILEFYLNQVPYARMRRGVKQAAREYFDRDLDTLNPKETLALAVLVRSPSRLDLKKGTEAIEKPVQRLAARLHARGVLSNLELERIQSEPLRVTPAELRIDAAHFVARVPETDAAEVATTLDGSLQRRAQQLLDRQIASLADRGVTDGAALVVDHETDEILVWANGGGFTQEEGGQIDMVTVPRQPGSTLKPFAYALALERGWTAATVLVDEPIAEAVGNGLHNFRNYSRHYYGPIRLREALGNSLNVPAIKTVQFTGRAGLFELLGRLGVSSLTEHPDFYGDGLALGNGELSLFELVSAYAVLARGGVRRPLKCLKSKFEGGAGREEHRVLSAETSSLIADILSDPEARALEFGRSSVLSLPLQTAVKTGTSNDYRDAWTVGFSHRYTVGVWMGNLDRKPMHEVTGSIGPALVFRALLAELHRNREGKPLYLSRKLRQIAICRESGALPGESCPRAMEWFRPGSEPQSSCPLHSGTAVASASSGEVRIGQPSPGLHLALDPRIPDELERFALELQDLPKGARVEWWMDDAPFAESNEEDGRALWPLIRGRHVAKARVWNQEGAGPTWTKAVTFRVK